MHWHSKKEFFCFFFWSSRMGNLLQPVRQTKTLPVRSITQIWVVTRHQYCARFSKVILRGETSSGVVTCRLFPRTSARHEEARAGFSPSRLSLRSRSPPQTISWGTGKQLNRCFGYGNKKISLATLINITKQGNTIAYIGGGKYDLYSFIYLFFIYDSFIYKPSVFFYHIRQKIYAEAFVFINSIVSNHPSKH